MTARSKATLKEGAELRAHLIATAMVDGHLEYVFAVKAVDALLINGFIDLDAVVKDRELAILQKMAQQQERESEE